MTNTDSLWEDFTALRERLNDIKVDFLLIDLKAALTMAGMAASTEDPQKCDRNKRNARRVYDDAVKFREKVVATPQERKELDGKLNQLRMALDELGEHF